MTLIATRRYVQRNAQSCLEHARVVRTLRRPAVKPGRRSRRPRAFLITVVADQSSKARSTSPPPPPDPATEEVVTVANATAVPGPVETPGHRDTVDAQAVPPPLTEAQAVAYSRPFRICRACGRVAPRALLAGADGPYPRHPSCAPTAPDSGVENVDA